MTRKFASILFLILFSATPALAMPKDGCGGDCASCHTLTAKEANTLLKGMGGEVKQVKPSQVKGLWEVTFSQEGKTAIAYVDYGKKHIIPGAIFNIATKKPIAGGTAAAPKLEKGNIATIPLTNSIILGNPKGSKKLFLFTDPDCPFCAKQHVELNKLIVKNRDLAIYVKLNPLKIHPKAYDHARVLLQGQSSKLLDEAFSGKELPAATPQTPVAGVEETMKLAQTLGINSTPTLILPDGTVLVGYQEAGAIEKALLKKKRKKK